MGKKPSRTKPKARVWPRKITLGRESVTVYRRATSSGGTGYMVANYADGKRRFDSYATETEALDAAGRLVRQLSERQVVAASLTNEQAAEYAAAVQTLAPFNLPLSTTASTVATCLKLVGGDLPSLHAAAKFYAARHKQITRKPVAEIVSELLVVKEGRRCSPRYLSDLQSRLGHFAADFKKDCCDVTTAQAQAWFDALNLSPQSYKNYRTVAHLFFEFAVARGYAADNPIAGVEKLKVRASEAEVFTPAEIRKLLAAAAPDFLPCLAIGAFAGLRSAEIVRLEWSDVRLAERHIVIGKDKAKTASRRIIPLHENLAVWLAPYAAQSGMMWQGTPDGFSVAQRNTAKAAGVKWKKNALRHSYASYRFAQTADAGRVAGELGNSAAIVHRHYRELVKLADAEKWFAVKPEGDAANIMSMACIKN